LKTDICIVDDNREYLATASKLFEHHGYSVNTVDDPIHALECIRKSDPRLILLDIMMPNIDGFSLLKEIKDDSLLGQIPVVVISGKIFPPEKKKAISLGAEAYISKPVNGNDLLAEVANYLGDS